MVICHQIIIKIFIDLNFFNDILYIRFKLIRLIISITCHGNILSDNYLNFEKFKFFRIRFMYVHFKLGL